MGNLGDAPTMNPHSREGGVEVLDGCQIHQYVHDKEGIKQNANRDSSRRDIQPSRVITTENGAGSTVLEDDTPLHNREDLNGDKSVPLTDDSRSIKSGDDSDGAESSSGKINVAIFPSFENDPLLWMPPEPADMEDDTESVAKNGDYDDDDYCDGTKWVQSSFSNSGEEHQTSPNPREVRQKAMLEAMNGQLKILVSRFLASAGISFPKEESGENWLEIVTSLSWEAALHIKPDASEGKEMDPGSYVKVKCIACGTCQQSEVIKGLVFKKNAAHKHMPTKFQNPRLLLLKGVLGHSDVGLSSFNSMEQEKDHLEKAISKMMEICNPNVILVEKTVSRDIQELLLKKGVTLVLDMKLHRLERIARCTCSPIISFSDVLMKPKLKQCDSFHIEKFVEEHNNTGEGGKRPSKTLLFLEGFPRPLGCTILLRGANSDELKKVKQVMQYTVFAAYHLILETSFFEDQRVFLNDKSAAKEENSVRAKAEPSGIACDTAPLSNSSITGSPTVGSAPALQLNVPTSDGALIECANGDAALSSSPGTGALNLLTDSVSDELRDGTIIQYDSTLPLQSERLLSSVSGSLLKIFDMFRHQNIYLPVTSSQETTDHQKEGRLEISQEITSNGFHSSEKAEELAISTENTEHTANLEEKGSLETSQETMAVDSFTKGKPRELLVSAENTEQQYSDCISKVRITDKDGIDDVLDSQSILILMSSQCISKHTVCDPSHLSRIKYYGNFDVSLGRYLQDILHNQTLSCSSCGEPPESHMYSYTHRNGNLTVLVTRLPRSQHLSGESEGKIWMWTRCLRCERESGISKSTPRVVISTEARNLSFGKFLELSFSSHSAARRLSICGHLVNRDCLRFFGLGSKVAMFRYSSVEIYAACKPQPSLEFYNPNRLDWFKEEARNVLAKGVVLFSEVTSLLQQLKNQYPDTMTMNYCAMSHVKEFSALEEMLTKEKGEFEDSLMKALGQVGMPSTSAHLLLDVNWLYQELLLELYVWDRRLHHLLQCKPATQESNAACKHLVETSTTDLVNKMSEDSNEISKEIDEFTSRKTLPQTEPADTSECMSSAIYVGNVSAEGGQFGKANTNEHEAPLIDQNSVTTQEFSCTNNGNHEQEACVSISMVDNTAQITKEPSIQNLNGSGVKTNGVVAHPTSMKEEPVGMPQQLRTSEREDMEGWIWSPFSESRSAYRRDLEVGSLEKFDLVNNYSPSHLSPLREQVSEEVDSVHFTVGPGGNVLSVSEDEISSIISRALAISEDRRHLMDTITENETVDSKGEPTKVMEKSYSLISEGSLTSSSWSSIGSFDSEASYSSASSALSSEELYSNSDSSLLLSSLHPEIPVNEKVALKGKYSVICIHAYQFYTLRKKCCPSELAYITSLSRCKKWDAQGGKSKAFFAKTMDDRFIIKQIKKTEFESFLKFAPDYFKNVYVSLDSGSQTCLAKILGIYQVKQIRNSKEAKIDLMVMENLLFGHNISRTYDLKGAVFSRHVSDSDDRETVYLDQNFIEHMRISPIYIGGRTKHLLQRAIWNDTAFLTSINVMDYSLLVGVDKQRHELVFGIIDYLRQYTWDKQLETWVKTSLVVPKNVSPTVISPKEYKKRFRKFMTKYFLTVPDTWSSDHCSGPCKFCGRSSSLSEALDEKPPEHSIEACA